MADVLLDILTAIILTSLAWASLTSRQLFRCVVLYIAFGFVMALAWVRLAAPDLALTDAAIGAGLTGALLLDALSQLGEPDEGGAD